jgi:hypothetical protein
MMEQTNTAVCYNGTGNLHESKEGCSILLTSKDGENAADVLDDDITVHID